MSYPDFVAARQLIAERRYGAPLRARVKADIAREEAEYQQTVANIRQRQQQPQVNTPAVLPPRPIGENEIVA